MLPNPLAIKILDVTVIAPGCNSNNTVGASAAVLATASCIFDCTPSGPAPVIIVFMLAASPAVLLSEALI